MRNICGKVVEKFKTHTFCIQESFPLENVAIFEIMWENAW